MAGWAPARIMDVARRLGDRPELPVGTNDRQFVGRSNLGVCALSAVIGLGLAGLVAGWPGFRALHELSDGQQTVPLDAALCLLIAGTGLLLRGKARAAPILAGMLVVLLASMSCIQSSLGVSPMNEPAVPYPAEAGRAGLFTPMSDGTAACFFIGGIVVSLSSIRMPRRVRPAMLELVALMLFVAATEGILEQTLASRGEQIWPLFDDMSVVTAVGLMCLAVAFADMSWTTRRLSGFAPAADWVLTTAFLSATMFDILSPVGVIGGLAYLPVIFLAARTGSNSLTIWTAATATFFAMLAFFLSPQYGATIEDSVVNRIGEIAAIWTVAGLLCRVSRRTEALRKSEQRYTLAVDAAKVGLWDRALDGSEAYWWSPVSYWLLGYCPGDLAPSRRAFSERLHPDDRQRVKAAYLEHLVRRTPYEVELRLRHRTLGYRWFLCTGQATWSRTGQPVRITGTLVDIDDRKRTERERSETEWVATVSHELRTPMTSCLGALSIAKSGRYGTLPEPVTKLLDLAQSNGSRLVSLVDDLLTSQRLSSGHFEMQLEVVSAHQVVNTAVEAVAHDAASRRVRVETQLCRGNPKLRVDPDRLVQVMVNFLTNAIKYGPEGGSVILRTDWSGSTLRMSVRDEGPGIPERDHHRMFERFFRVEAETHRQVGGNGLGLSISKSIIDGLGGQIGFDSPVGEGATFWVEFPVVIWALADQSEPLGRRHEETQRLEQGRVNAC